MPALGDFGIQSGGGWGGWIIRLGTFSRYGHACIAVSEVAGDLVEIVEATPGGARCRWARIDEFVWSRCPLSDAQRVIIAAEAERCVGLPYDFRDIASFVLRFFGAKIRGHSEDHADDRLICSELVAWCYRVAGHDVAPTRETAPGDVAPGDLADHIIREAP